MRMMLGDDQNTSGRGVRAAAGIETTEIATAKGLRFQLIQDERNWVTWKRKGAFGHEILRIEEEATRRKFNSSNQIW